MAAVAALAVLTPAAVAGALVATGTATAGTVPAYSVHTGYTAYGTALVDDEGTDTTLGLFSADEVVNADGTLASNQLAGDGGYSLQVAARDGYGDGITAQSTTDVSAVQPGTNPADQGCSAATTGLPVTTTSGPGEPVTQVGVASIGSTCDTAGPVTSDSAGSSSSTTTVSPGTFSVDLTEGFDGVQVGPWSEWESTFGDTEPAGITATSTVSALLAAEGYDPTLTITSDSSTVTTSTASGVSPTMTGSEGTVTFTFGPSTSGSSPLFTATYQPYTWTVAVSPTTGAPSTPSFSTAPMVTGTVLGSVANPAVLLAGTPLASEFVAGGSGVGSDGVYVESGGAHVADGLGQQTNGACYGLCVNGPSSDVEGSPVCNPILTATAGTPQSVQEGQTTIPLVVTDTCGGNVKPDDQIVWSVTGSDGATVKVPTGDRVEETDPAGQAEVVATAGEVAGAVVVTASDGDGSTATFDVDVVPSISTTTTSTSTTTTSTTSTTMPVTTTTSTTTTTVPVTTTTTVPVTTTTTVPVTTTTVPSPPTTFPPGRHHTVPSARKQHHTSPPAPVTTAPAPTLVTYQIRVTG